MDFFKSGCCACFGTAVVLIAACGVFHAPAGYHMALCVVVPLLLSFSVRSFMKHYDYRDRYVEAGWHPDEDE